MQALHERLQFDTANGQVLDGPRRYVLLRADVLMGLFDGLAQDAREAALRAFGHAVATRGADSLRAYAAAPGGADGEALQRIVEAAAASLGWGRWSLARDGAGLALEVRNSPFAAAASGSGPACHAIAGMLQGLAGIVLGAAASARETSCACASGDGRCRFSAHLVSPAPADRPATPHLKEKRA